MPVHLEGLDKIVVSESAVVSSGRNRNPSRAHLTPLQGLKIQNQATGNNLKCIQSHTKALETQVCMSLAKCDLMISRCFHFAQCVGFTPF